MKSQNQKSNVNLRNKKSIRKLKSRNQMSISEARKSSFEFSLLTFDFRLWPPPLPPSPINSEDLVSSLQSNFATRPSKAVFLPCYYIIFPFLKVFETWIVSGSKCQSERIRATSTPRMSQNLQNICRNVGFSKRIFENFASGNRLCSRKNGFASGSKLRKTMGWLLGF